jgi:hypothetical protein
LKFGGLDRLVHPVSVYYMLVGKHEVCMTDRIAEILEGHIAMAERQLRYIGEGVQFGDITEPIPAKEIELVALIHKWNDELRRHRERQNA